MRNSNAFGGGCTLVLALLCVLGSLTLFFAEPITSKYFLGFTPFKKFGKMMNTRGNDIRSFERRSGFFKRYRQMEEICHRLLANTLSCMSMPQPYTVTSIDPSTNQESHLKITKDINFGLYSIAVPLKQVRRSSSLRRSSRDPIWTNCEPTASLDLRRCHHIKRKPKVMLILKMPVTDTGFLVSHEMGRLKWRFKGKHLRPFPQMYDVPNLLDFVKRTPFLITEFFDDAVPFNNFKITLLQKLSVTESHARTATFRVIYMVVLWALLFNHVGIHHGDLHSNNFLIDMPTDNFHIRDIGMESVHIIDLDSLYTPFFKNRVFQASTQPTRPDASLILEHAANIMSKDSRNHMRERARLKDLCVKTEEGYPAKCTPQLQRNTLDFLCELLRIEDDVMYKNKALVGLPTCHNLLKLVKLITPLTVSEDR